MTLLEFKALADKTAEAYGIERRNVTVMASIFGGSNDKDWLSYSCQAWIIKEAKHIRTDIQRNSPEASLESFKDLLEIHFKQYSTKEKDIEL